MSAPTQNDELILQAYLAEYNHLHTELCSRFDAQRQAINFLIALLAATLGALASEHFALTPQLMLFLPLLAAPLAFIFFDNELLIWGIIFALHTDLKPAVETLLHAEVLREKIRFLDAKVRNCHFILSIGRWLLFLIPTVGPLVYAITYSPQTLNRDAYLALFLADLVVVTILLWAMAMSWRFQRYWMQHAPPHYL